MLISYDKWWMKCNKGIFNLICREQTGNATAKNEQTTERPTTVSKALSDQNEHNENPAVNSVAPKADFIQVFLNWYLYIYIIYRKIIIYIKTYHHARSKYNCRLRFQAWMK